MSRKRELARAWAIGGALCVVIAIVAMRGGGRSLITMNVLAVDPGAPFGGPEELAERVRYSEPFELDAPTVVVNVEGEADVLVSLVQHEGAGPPAIAEASLRGPRGQGRIAGVESGRYRLRVVAEGRGDVRIRLAEGGISPLWSFLAGLLVLLPALSVTGRWMRARVLG